VLLTKKAYTPLKHTQPPTN